MRPLISFLIVSFLMSTFNLTPGFAQDSSQWHLPDGVIDRLGKGTVEAIAYSPDGTRLAVGGGIGIWIYDMATHQEVALLTGHTDVVLSVAYSPDGTTLTSGSYDGTVRLWDAATGDLRNTLEGHTSSVRSVAYSPDGTTLASGSDDGTVLLWRLASTPTPALKGDVNGDGTVNIADLVLVADALGKTGQNAADVNGDGQINIADLVLVAGAIGTSAAAPSLHLQSLGTLIAADVKQWLSAAQQLDLTDAMSQRGILFLQHFQNILLLLKELLNQIIVMTRIN